MEAHTFMTTLRTFFAIDLPQPMRESIQHVIDTLREKKWNIHFSKLQHLHITLQFLKEVRLDDIPLLMKNVRQTLQDIPPFEMEWDHLELFPDSDHPRIISLAPKSNELLNTVAKRIGQGILATHYPIETRLYRPHLTLGKLTRAPLKMFPIQLPTFLVNEIVFYQSNPSREGSLYTLLDRITLTSVKS